MRSTVLLSLWAIVFIVVCTTTCSDAQWFGGSGTKKKDENPNVALLSYAPVDPNAIPPPAPVTASTTTSTTTPAPTTTKKKGFFGGLFGGGSKKDKESTTSTTTTTTTPAPTVSTTKKSGGFFGGLFGGGSKKDKTSTTTAATPTSTKSTSKAGSIASTTSTVRPAVTTPSTKAAAGPVPAATPTIKPASPTPAAIPSAPTTSSTAKPTASVAASTPTTAPALPPKPTPKPVDAFPPLPPPKGAPAGGGPAATVSSTTMASAWNKPLPPSPPGSPTSTGARPGSPVSSGPTRAPLPGGPTRSSTPSYTEGSTATDEELATLSEQLFAKENTNLNKYVTVNYQRQTLSSSSVDDAPEPLLTIDERQVYAVPTIEKMRALFNNYELDTMVNEHVTAMEKKEENDFVDALLATNVMRTAMLFLQKKGVVTADPKTHHDLLKTIWFSLYSRGNGKIGSSGFEHVFLNEVSDGTMIGLHNWLYLYEQEKAGRLDYQGYLKKMDLGSKGEIAKVRLSFDKLMKPSNSLFVATSPELEIALYTVCFQMRPDKECPLAYNGKNFVIKTFTFRYRGKNLIGGAWPNF